MSPQKLGLAENWGKAAPHPAPAKKRHCLRTHVSLTYYLYYYKPV